MRSSWILGLLLGLLLAGISQAQPAAPPAPPPAPAQASELSGKGDPAEAAQALEVVRSFVRHLYARQWGEAFRLVRGVEDPERAGSRFGEFVGDARASYGYRMLSECEDNLFALAAAVENHPGGPPPTLEALVASGQAFPQGLPTCPGKGTYRYRREGEDYRIWCATDAHAILGIRGDYPAFSRSQGLTLGNQQLGLRVPVDFDVQDWSVEIDDYDELIQSFVVRQAEHSRTQPGQPYRLRTGRFVLSRQGGQWLIDLALSNRDMAFVFDPDRWAEEMSPAAQTLYYFQMAEASDYKFTDLESRTQLEVRICEANLRSLSLALERWSAEHHGAYPKGGWTGLARKDLPELPTCPAGGTYRFRLEPPGSYRIWCSGHAHKEAGLAPDYPALTPALGVTRGDAP